jgi:hypothetical protein
MINRSPYFGFGIIFAPKSEEYSSGLIINFMVWEFNYRWGISKKQQTQLEILQDQIQKVYSNGI